MAEKKNKIGQQLAVLITPYPKWMPDKDIGSLDPPCKELWQDVAMGEMPARHPQAPSKSKAYHLPSIGPLGGRRRYAIAWICPK